MQSIILFKTEIAFMNKIVLNIIIVNMFALYTYA